MYRFSVQNINLFFTMNIYTVFTFGKLKLRMFKIIQTFLKRYLQIKEPTILPKNVINIV